jgi:hypothetical protein
MTGNLFISSLDHVLEEDLHQAFGLVESIDGNIIIRDSTGLTTLYFLPNLKEVGNVTLVGNKNLVDARLPALERAGVVTISRNDRLCPARYLSLNTAVTDETDCVSLDAEVLIGISQRFFLGAPTVLIQEFVTQTVFGLFPSNVCMRPMRTIQLWDLMLFRYRFSGQMKPQLHSMRSIFFSLFASLFSMLTPEDPKTWLSLR